MRVVVDELCEAVSPRDYEIALATTPLELQGTDFVPLFPPRVQLRVRREGSKMVVEAAVHARFLSPCARCLADSTTDLNLAATDLWPLCRTSDEKAEFLVAPFMEDSGRIVNLAEYGLTLLVEHLPVRVLCSGTCRGLCPTCGLNRNEGDCACGQGEIDPRLAVLGRLLLDKGGVRGGTTEKENIKGTSR